MAWSNSKVFARTMLEQMNGGHAFNWATDTINVAVFLGTNTPSNTVITDAATEYNGAASQWVAATYEVPNTGTYSAGGSAVTPLSFTQTTNVVTFTSSGAPSWTGATMTAVYGCLVYDTTISNIGLSYNYFGGSQSVTAGTFTINWNASGIATITC
jgi:hypothetical protein